MAYLVVQQEGKTEHVQITDAVTLLGRSAECHVCIKDSKTSRQHCRIEECDRGYKLVDLESANGTIVNGEPVAAKILAAGDVIEIGAASITYEVERADVLKARRLSARTRRPASRKRRQRGLMRAESRASAADTDDGEDDTTGPPKTETREPGPYDTDRDIRLAGGVDIDPDADPDETYAPILPDGSTQADIAIAVRRLLNRLLTDFDEAGVLEVERLVNDYTGDALTPHMQHLIEDRDMMAHLLEINRALNSEEDLDGLLNRILDETIALTSAERGFILRQDPGTKKPIVEVARNFDREPVRNAEEKFSHTVVKQVLEQKRPLLSSNAHEEERFREDQSVLQMRLRSVLCAPLTVKDYPFGVLYIDNRFETGVFSERDLLWLEAIADQAAIAIENRRLIADLKAHEESLAEANALLEERLAVRDQELAGVKATLKKLKGDPRALAEDLPPRDTKYPYDEFIGRSPALLAVFKLLDRVTDNDVPVMITGENGTGKELVARALHQNGPRKAHRFVAENCAAIPEHLFESTFFGHVRGAFTGAVKDKPGLFEQAHKGTLFLDEIGDLPQEMQKKFLRVLETGSIRKVGGSQEKPVDVRIVGATNRDLRQLVKDGVFREDLFFRLNVVTVHLPPLRDRVEDIPLLADFFLAQAFEKLGTEPKDLHPDVLPILAAYDWPGNVRELTNIISHAVALSADDPVLLPEHFPAEIRGEVRSETDKGAALAKEFPDGTPLKEAVKVVTERLEAELIQRAGEACGWKKIDMADRLGITRPTLDAKLKAYDIEVPK